MRYHRQEHVAGRVVEGQAYIVTPHDDRLHTLNETATLLWTMSEDGCTARDAAEALTARFDVEHGTALSDAQACLNELVTLGILLAEPVP
jgi:hypothetical protein